MTEDLTRRASAVPVTRRRSVLSRNRDFLLLWSGESISLLGSEISVVALPSLAVLGFDLDAAGVGALVALQWIPFLVLAPIMGVFTDRLRRRPVMQICNLARFAVLGSLPAAAVLGHLTVTHLYAAALLKGIFDVTFQLAYQALLPELLDRADLVQGNVLTQLSRALAQVIGRAAGGALGSVIGAARSVGVDAVSYLVAAVTLTFVRKEESPPTPGTGGLLGTLRDLRSAVTLALGNRLVRHLMLATAFGNLGGSLTLPMIFVYGYRDLHLSPAQVGLALSIGSAGVPIGAALARRITSRCGLGRSVVLTHFLLCIAFGLLPVAQRGGTTVAIAIIVLSLVISSFTMPITNVSVMTLVQKVTPAQVMGRVTGAVLPFVWGANALGPVLGSLIATATTTTVAFLLASCCAGTAIVWLLTGGLHHLRDDEVPEPLRIRIA